MPSSKFNKQRPKYTPPARCHSRPPGPPWYPGDYDKPPQRPTLLATLSLKENQTISQTQQTCQTWLYPLTDPTQWHGIATANDGGTYLITVEFNSPNQGARFDVVALGPGQPFVTNGLTTDNVRNQSTFVLRWTELPPTDPTIGQSSVQLQVLS